MSANLTDPIFHDETAARTHLAYPLAAWSRLSTLRRGREHQEDGGQEHRPGLLQCNSCREPFTVTLGTVMERSHLPLPKWVLGFHLIAASKKGMSAHQLGRMLGITYKSAWFMAHRIREAMGIAKQGPIGGENKVVEADETYVGGKARNRKD